MNSITITHPFALGDSMYSLTAMSAVVLEFQMPFLVTNRNVLRRNYLLQIAVTLNRLAKMELDLRMLVL
jgi:hypothetical protein